MTSHKKQTRLTSGQNSQSIEHAEVFDDNLLPSTSEIQKLHQLDPNILPWLKQRAEKEQDFRHSAFNTQIAVNENKHKREHTTIRLGLLFYTVLVLSCLSISGVLLYNGKTVSGSVFGGTAAILGFGILISRRSAKPENK